MDAGEQDCAVSLNFKVMVIWLGVLTLVSLVAGAVLIFKGVQSGEIFVTTAGVGIGAFASVISYHAGANANASRSQNSSASSSTSTPPTS